MVVVGVAMVIEVGEGFLVDGVAGVVAFLAEEMIDSPMALVGGVMVATTKNGEELLSCQYQVVSGLH